MNDETFILQLTGEVPEAKENVLDGDNLGLISLQIMAFRSFTQEAINNNDLEVVGRCFAFVDRVFELISDEANNSLCLSYLAKLDLKKDGRIIGLLSARLSKVIAEINQAHSVESRNDKFKNFIKSLGSNKA